MFDECHKAKNGAAGQKETGTKVAATVLALQQRLPRARIVYCSATGISEVGNMTYMSRLVNDRLLSLASRVMAAGRLLAGIRLVPTHE